MGLAAQLHFVYMEVIHSGIVTAMNSFFLVMIAEKDFIAPTMFQTHINMMVALSHA